MLGVATVPLARAGARAGENEAAVYLGLAISSAIVAALCAGPGLALVRTDSTPTWR